MFCNADALHSGCRVEDSDCDYVSLTFHPRLLAGFEGCVIGRKYVAALVGAAPSLGLSPEENWQRRVLDALDQIYRLSQKRPGNLRAGGAAAAAGIWGELYRHREAQGEGSLDPEKLQRLRVILSYLHENYGEKITLEDVARQVGLCKSECCRFFKRQMRQSLFDYLLDYRVAAACPCWKREPLRWRRWRLRWASPTRPIFPRCSALG